MSKIERLEELIAKADEAYNQQVTNILNEIIPRIDIEARTEIAKKICCNRPISMDLDEIILMHDGRAFDNPAITDILTERIQKTRKDNKELKPSIDKCYWCETCGSHSHEAHPITGYCFVCNTDNWEPEKTY